MVVLWSSILERFRQKKVKWPKEVDAPTYKSIKPVVTHVMEGRAICLRTFAQEKIAPRLNTLSNYVDADPDGAPAALGELAAYLDREQKPSRLTAEASLGTWIDGNLAVFFDALMKARPFRLPRPWDTPSFSPEYGFKYNNNTKHAYTDRNLSARFVDDNDNIAYEKLLSFMEMKRYYVAPDDVFDELDKWTTIVDAELKGRDMEISHVVKGTRQVFNLTRAQVTMFTLVIEVTAYCMTTGCPFGIVTNGNRFIIVAVPTALKGLCQPPAQGAQAATNVFFSKSFGPSSPLSHTCSLLQAMSAIALAHIHERGKLYRNPDRFNQSLFDSCPTLSGPKVSQHH